MDLDTEVRTLEEAKPLVEREYPKVIASVFRKCRTTDSEDLGGRHKSFIDLYEVFVRFLCIVQLQELRQRIPNLRERLPQKEKTLEFLKRPSTGGWNGLLRTLCNLDFDQEKTLWADKIATWYNGRKNNANREILELLDRIEGIRFQKKTGTPNAEICNALVNYRNKFAHGASLREETTRRRLPQLESVLVYLLSSASFLQNLDNIFVERLEVTENDQWLAHAKKLNGTSEEPVDLLSPRKLTISEVYIASTQDGEIGAKAVSLAPFILRKANPELKRPDLYLYNDAWRTKLEYISYGTGGHYYHDELHSGFEDLITLKIRPGVEEDTHHSLSEEERQERAEDLYKRAVTLKEQGLFEDAVEALEKSVEYERRAQTFLEIGRLQHRLGDPVESVQQTLQRALDLDPNHAEVLAFEASLSNAKEVVDTDGKYEKGRVTNDSEQAIEFPSIFQAIVPSPWQRYAQVICFLCILLWYGTSVLVEYLAGSPYYIRAVLLQFFICSIMVAGFKGRSILLRIRTPLSLQLDSMRLERFQDWYDEQIRLILGHFVRQDGKLQIRKTLAREKYYYLGGVFWLITVTSAAFLLATVGYTDSIVLATKRVVDWAILFIGSYPAIRYVVTTTVLIMKMSQLSLKPTLTNINDDGIRSLGPLILFNLTLGSLGGVAYILLARVVVTGSTYIDLGFFAFGMPIYLTWGLGMPLSIHYAMRRSKSKVVHQYAAHIERAFRNFLEDPDEAKLEEYEWLREQQSVIQGITTWPLSIGQTLLIVLCNLSVFATMGWYVAVRLGYWQQLMASF